MPFIFNIKQKPHSLGGGIRIFNDLLRIYNLDNKRIYDLNNTITFGELFLEYPNSYNWGNHIWYCLGLCNTVFQTKWNKYLFYNTSYSNPRRIKYYLKSLFDRYNVVKPMLYSSKIIAPCNYTAKIINKLGGKNIFASYPAIDNQLYKSNNYDYYLSTCHFRPEKRIELAIKACIKSNQKLIIIGSMSNKKYSEYLLRFSGYDNIKFLGEISDFNRLRDIYSNCKALINVHINYEIDLTVNEAFASSKPVITCNDSNGILEFVKDGFNGLVSNSNKNDLAEILKSLDTKKAIELGKNAREFILPHTINKHYSEIINYLRGFK